jgi:uncharacterized membrane protein AbrB (regulator of aidB expression)
MSDAMIGVTAFAATGLAKPFLAPLRDFVIVLAGVSMGSGASPHALSALTHYPISLAMMTLALAAMTGSSYAVLVRSPGYSRQTALFAAVPGALSYVFVAAQGTGADMPRVAVAQVFRIFVLMAIVPLMAGRLGPAAPLIVPHDPALVTLTLVASAFAVAYRLSRLKLNGALFYAAIGVSVLAHGSGLAPGRPSLRSRSRLRRWSAAGSARASSASTGICCAASSSPPRALSWPRSRLRSFSPQRRLRSSRFPSSRRLSPSRRAASRQ